MEEQLKQIDSKLTELQTKVEAIYSSAEKTRKYFLWTLIITVGALVIPLVLLPLFISPFLQSQGIGNMGL